MQIPDFETRCAIVQTKASQHNTTLDPPVVEFLANYVTTNIRELEGVLNQLLAYCEMRNLPPDLAVATTLFSFDKKRPKHLSARQVIDKTARHFQIVIDDMLGPKRDKDDVQHGDLRIARFLAPQAISAPFGNAAVAIKSS